MLIECKEFDGHLYVPIEGVSKAIDMAVRNEREECANVCDEMAARDKLSNYYKIAANAIRDRSNQDKHWPFPKMLIPNDRSEPKFNLDNVEDAPL